MSAVQPSPAQITAHTTALLVIDVQEAFLHPPYTKLSRSTPHLEDNIASTLAAFRNAALPVYHIHHHSKEIKSNFHPSNTSFVLPQAYVAPLPTEPVITKYVNSGFIGTDLHERLQAAKIDTLVVTGLTTIHCVSTTVRMAGNMDYKVILVSDGTAAYAQKSADGLEEFDGETMHKVSLAELNEEFAEVWSAEQVIAGVQAL